MRHFAAAATFSVAVACGGTSTSPSLANWFSSFEGPPVTFAGRLLDNATAVGVSNATVQFEQAAGRPSLPPATATTDAAGAFAVNVPRGFYLASVGGVFLGRINVTAVGTRGDLFVNGGICESRYGASASY